MKIQKKLFFILFLFCTVFVFSSRSQAGNNVWTTVGPYGANFMSIAINPDNENIVFATTPDGQKNVFKSVDGGSTWQASSIGIPDYSEMCRSDCIVFDPEDSTTLYLGSTGGIYKSINSGQSWNPIGTLLEDGETKTIRAWSLAISPLDGTLYAGGYGFLFGGDAGGGLYRSKDNGSTWERLTQGAPTDPTFHEIVVPSNAPYIVYAGGDGGIFKSLDRGDTWQSLNMSFATTPTVKSIAVDPFDAQVVYIGIQGLGGGIYKTTNGGQSWTPIGTGLGTNDIRDIKIDSGNQQIIYVAGADGVAGVYRSADNLGQSWLPVMDGMGSRPVFSLALDHRSPQSIYAGTGAGIWKNTLTSGPQDYSISINDGAVFTNQTAVTVRLTAPVGTSEVILSNDGGFVGAVWMPFETEKTWTLPTYGEYVLPKVVYARFKTYGNVSGVYQDDIVLDTVAPTGMIEISPSTYLLSPQQETAQLNESDDYVVHLPLIFNNAHPGFKIVRLSLLAADDFSGVSSMLISNSVDFTNAQWEEFTSTKDWWIPDSGEQTVYIKYRDRAGNISEAYFDKYFP